MKAITNLSLSMLAISMLFASCNKSGESVNQDNDKGTTAMMTIKFDNPPVNRGVGTPTGESTITEGTVLVFRTGTGILDGMATFTSIANPIPVKITAGTRDVYVIANTGIDFMPIQNVSDLKNYTKYALSAIHADGSNLPMSGVALAQNATSATVATPATATVTMQFMCSKVNIAWNTTSLNAALSSFVVTNAYIMNVHSTTDCFAFGTDNLTAYSTAFLTGLNNPSGFNAGAYYPNLSFTNAYNANLEFGTSHLASDSGNNFFYIFEDNVVTSPTIVVIQGTVTDAGVTTTYYYPIVINGAQNTNSGDGTATVVRGQSYLVTATIKGFGNTNPYEPITNASMDVTIIPASWSPVININETFN